jgi:polar amino acid transport system substrate-binding protein
VRGDDGVGVFTDAGLEVGAGIRQPLTTWLESHPGHRMVEPAYMQIRQAVALSRHHDAASVDFVRRTVRELIATGFVAEALIQSGQDAQLVAKRG